MAHGVWNMDVWPKMQGVMDFPGRTATRTRVHERTHAGAPLAWSRALAFGIVSGGAGVLGHDILTHQPTHVGAVLLAVAFATLVARPLAPLRVGPGLMLAGVITLQTIIHLACVAAFDGMHTMSSDEHMQMMAHAPVHAAPALWMLAVHLAVTLLGAFVLLQLEAHAWEMLCSVVGRVLRAFRCTRTTRDTAVRYRELLTAHPCPHLTGSAWLVRGPPQCAASH